MVLPPYVLALLLLASLASAFNQTKLDQTMRFYAFQYGQYLQDWRDDDDPVWKEMYDALELEDIRGVSFAEHRQTKKKTTGTRNGNRHEYPQDRSFAKKENLRRTCRTRHCLHVNPSPSSSDENPQFPWFSSLAEALEASRQLGVPHATTIGLHRGIHTLTETLHLGPQDSGLTIQGYDSDVWISGGIEIPDDTEWDWDCQVNINVRVANLTELLQGRSNIPTVPSLFSTHKRLIRARYPNGDPELAQWGYASRDKYKYSIHADEVVEWHRPPQGSLPTFTFVDFRDHHPDIPLKNDSTMAYYNAYASGHGGVCAELWGPEADSYWCSNASSGGWAEVDRECATTGQLQIPVKLTYNATSEVGRRFQSYQSSSVGGIVHAWHSQSWAMHMFPIAQHHRDNHTFVFAPGAGRQGARNWCRCDQCAYCAGWCGQHKEPPDNSDTRLIGGTWMVENLLDELDAPGEFYFDSDTQLLYMYPNGTSGLKGLRFALLETLIHVDGATDITIANVGFRDSLSTYATGTWSPPSGGDWSLHRGGAFLISNNASDIMIQEATFSRLDGNAVFLSGRTRRVHIEKSEFAWIGESAVATWGDTNGYDATAGNFPSHTQIVGNVMREIGLYQKQSSGVGHVKAAESIIRNNIIFNTARAGINFNELMGGGDVVERNVLFNTCRESGDHGPINSWDRQAYLAQLDEDQPPTFEAKRRRIEGNWIMANYGASEGVDNDDGSSWFHVKNNVFYDAEGFKMDYGGHDSIYEGNVVISYPHKRARGGGPKCINFGSFLPHRGHVVRGNHCIVPNGPNGTQPVIQLAECHRFHGNLHSNVYYTPSGEAWINCNWNDHDPPIPVATAAASYGIETDSEARVTPSIEEIMTLTSQALFPKESLPFSSLYESIV